MKPYDSNIEDIFRRKLDQEQPVTGFNILWKQYALNQQKPRRLKTLVLVPAMLLLMVLLAVGFAFNPKEDKTDYPFVNDPGVIGKWQAVDFIDHPDQFSTVQKFCKGKLFLTDLVFIKGGKMLTAVNEGNNKLSPTSFTWTEGMVICKEGKTASTYEIKNIDGTSYMFLPWKNGDYKYFHMNPSYYVLKKVDTLDYSDYEISRIEDKIDYPFVEDPQLLGIWETVDFAKDMDQFKPGSSNLREEPFLKKLEFNKNGAMSSTTSTGPVRSKGMSWTKGLVLDQLNKTASKYEIRYIDGESYLFYEWKSGDYVYREMKPQYYVLKKVK